MLKKGETFAQKLSDIFVEQGVITKQESEQMHKLFAQSSKEAFDDFLLEQGLVSEEALLDALAEYYQVPSYDVLGEFFNHQLLTLFPKEFLVRNAVIPLFLEEDILTMVASEPSEHLREEIDDYVDFGVEFNVGLRRDITDAVKEFYDLALTEVPEDGDKKEEEDFGEMVEKL